MEKLTSVLEDISGISSRSSVSSAFIRAGACTPTDPNELHPFAEKNMQLRAQPLHPVGWAARGGKSMRRIVGGRELLRHVSRQFRSYVGALIHNLSRPPGWHISALARSCKKSVTICAGQNICRCSVPPPQGSAAKETSMTVETLEG